jgi:hypothetical protein
MMLTALADKHPVEAFLCVAAFLAVIFVWVQGFKLVFAKTSGWKNLVEQFPAPEIERPGETFKKMTAWIGSSEFDGSFTLQLLQEGLLVRPYFARRSPILIPWQKVGEVQVSEGTVYGYTQNLLLKVACEKPVQFPLPSDVLQFLEGNIPADRFHKIKTPASIGEVFQERWQNRKKA